MRRFLKKTVEETLAYFDVSILRSSALRHAQTHDIDVLAALNGEYAQMLLRYLKQSKAQFRQDLFVLEHLGFKREGFFVEFGATNGVDMSNTHLLEKQFGWSGVLAEPARCWHESLKMSRSCAIETACVWKDSTSTLMFNEADSAVLSTIDLYSGGDMHKSSRTRGRKYEVRTISLVDLLEKHHAPRNIDYLSIDTEGSEFEILSHFDWDRYTFEVITCEHNYTPMREEVYELLTHRGYKRVHEEVSVVDDWYVRANPSR